MTTESTLLLAIWEVLLEHLPSSNRADAALAIVRAFEEYGIDLDDLEDASDEDDFLARAINNLREPEIEDDDDEYDED